MSHSTPQKVVIVGLYSEIDVALESEDFSLHLMHQSSLNGSLVFSASFKSEG